MSTLFDSTESTRLKELGMKLACGSRKELLAHARGVARSVALSRPDKTCTADDVQRRLHEELGLTPSALGPCAGSLFKGKDWRFTGDRIKSENTNNHGRELKVWRWVGDV